MLERKGSSNNVSCLTKASLPIFNQLHQIIFLEDYSMRLVEASNAFPPHTPHSHLSSSVSSMTVLESTFITLAYHPSGSGGSSGYVTNESLHAVICVPQLLCCLTNFTALWSLGTSPDIWTCSQGPRTIEFRRC